MGMAELEFKYQSNCGIPIGGVLSDYHWENYASENEYYAAIVENRY